MIDPFDCEGITVVEQEVEWQEYDDRYTFLVPDTLEKARSAYAYDPVFAAAVDVYCDKKRMRPEQCLREHTGMLLHVSKDLIDGSVVTVPEKLRLDMTEPTVYELKQMFVNDDITLSEFEDRLEDIL